MRIRNLARGAVRSWVEKPIRIAWRGGPPRETGTPAARHASVTATHSRKALLEMTMTKQPDGGPRRIRAAIIGFGLDGHDDHQRLSTGEHCLLVGGSAETHAEMLEIVLRLESELDRLGRRLAEMAPTELAEIAWRIDSPELIEIAHEAQGRPREPGSVVRGPDGRGVDRPVRAGLTRGRGRFPRSEAVRRRPGLMVPAAVGASIRGGLRPLPDPRNRPPCSRLKNHAGHPTVDTGNGAIRWRCGIGLRIQV